MATITGFDTSSLINFRTKYVSDAATASDTVTLSGLQEELPHCFLGVQMFNANGTLVLASAGSFAVTVKTLNTEQFEDPPDPTIDATAPTTVSWDGNTVGVSVTPTGVADVVTWKVVATFNQGHRG